MANLLLLASVCEEKVKLMKRDASLLSKSVNCDDKQLVSNWCYAQKGRKERNSHGWCVKCRVEGCDSYASFGFRAREFCKQHAPLGTRSFYGSVCETCGCKAHYGLASQKPQRCKKHKAEDMRFIRAGFCYLCKERATHGLPVGKKIFCSTHASSCHVLLTYPQCARGNCSRKVAVKGMLCAWHLHK